MPLTLSVKLCLERQVHRAGRGRRDVHRREGTQQAQEQAIERWTRAGRQDGSGWHEGPRDGPDRQQGSGVSRGLEPCRRSRPARDAAPTIAPTIFWSDRLAADAGPGRRRSQLPQIRPEALDAPDFVGVGEKPARQDGQRGRRNGGGSPWAPGHLARPRPRWTT